MLFGRTSEILLFITLAVYFTKIYLKMATLAGDIAQWIECLASTNLWVQSPIVHKLGNPKAALGWAM